MNDRLRAVADLLAERYGALGQAAAGRLERWLSNEVPFAFADVLERHLLPEHVGLLFDAFWQVLPFGTGGRRGRVGYGANRLNPTTLALTIQGHCNFLRRRFGAGPIEVVVANDVRVFADVTGSYGFLGPAHPLLGLSSRALAKLACEIYAGNGITAYLPTPNDDQATLSTPELSHAIARLAAKGGVNLSASHNPPDDNGVKVYDEFGSQPVAPEDQELLDLMAEVTEIHARPFADALGEGLVKPLPTALHEDYVAGYVRHYADFFAPSLAVPIVYTPLCGVGDSTAGDVLRALGFPVRVPPAERADGSFAVIPFRSPNPEVPQSTLPARRFADEEGATIVLSSDPDADRVGCEVKLRDGSWYHLDGNQIAAILGYALMVDPAGPRRKGLVIETLVTTKLLGKVVEARGESQLIDDLLVGFKYVADVLKRLSREGRYRGVTARPEDLVLAAEESHGVIALPHILDKDSAPACMYLAGLHQRLSREGRTLFDYYLSILEHLGGYDTVNRSIMLAGASGMARKDAIMAWLRSSPPATLGGHRVLRVVDYWDAEKFGPLVSESERLPRNVIQVFTERFVITVRPSGTEPKLKFYCQLLPPAQPTGASQAQGSALLAEIRAEAEATARLVYNDLLRPINEGLGEVGLLLTDLIELPRKRDFENRTIPALREAIAGGKLDSVEALSAWLRQEAGGLLPGADPLPALRQPLEPLAARWREEMPPSAGLAALITFSRNKEAA